MKINLLKCLFKNKENSNEPSLPIDFTEEYPQVTLSEEFKKRTYNLFFLVEKKQFENLSSLLIDHYPIINVQLSKHYQDLTDNNGNILKINFIDDFNGVVVHLISNNHDVIENIQNLKTSPPLPSVSFPDLNPEEYGSLQGNIDFWFTWLWKPYWTSLTSEQQSLLSLSDEWKEFIDIIN